MRKIVLILSSILLAVTVYGQSNWELQKDAKGVKVYTASFPGTRVKTFKAVSVYEQSVDELATTILDYEKYPAWIDGVEKGRLIDRISANEFIIRQVVLLPFPFENRESVQRIVVSKPGNGTIRITITEANELAPALEDHVRMTVTHGYWLIEETDNGTKLTYSFIADPGENIPAWLINSFIVSQPFQTLVQLKTYLSAN